MGLVEKMNTFEVLRQKKEAMYKEYLMERSGCCPLCERECTDEIEGYVRNEIIKMQRNPNYSPVVHGKEKKD